MKTVFALAFMVLTLAAPPSRADGDQAGAVCQMSPQAKTKRSQRLAELFAMRDEERELADGYAFRFPGDEETAADLMEVIRLERQCCSFFGFELTFEPNGGPIWFGVRGSELTKAFVESWMESSNAEAQP